MASVTTPSADAAVLRKAMKGQFPGFNLLPSRHDLLPRLQD
jgi:hypothetical protein